MFTPHVLIFVLVPYEGCGGDGNSMIPDVVNSCPDTPFVFIVDPITGTRLKNCKMSNAYLQNGSLRYPMCRGLDIISNNGTY